jgi:hypothetical protein
MRRFETIFKFLLPGQLIQGAKSVRQIGATPGSATWSRSSSTNLKRFRVIATRFEKTARNFLALTQLAGAWLWPDED